MPQHKNPESRDVHICIGEENRGHLEMFRNAADESMQRFDWWNITEHAKPKDLVIFYLTSPLSSFVAVGIVDKKVEDGEVRSNDKDSPWYGPNCFWISDVRMLPKPLTLREAKSLFPSWRYLNRPGVTSIPNDNSPQEIVSQFLKILQIPILSRASDLLEPPPRILSTTNRIIRDTALAQRVKSLYHHRCQFCNFTIDLGNGQKYAEAHHVRPLGAGHLGPDIIENILCVCPNHHAALDLGAIRVSMGDLRFVDGHSIHADFIDYHNNVIFKRPVLV